MRHIRSAFLLAVALAAAPSGDGAGEAPPGACVRPVVGIASSAPSTEASSGSTRRRAAGKPSFSTLPVANYIDTHIAAKLSAGGISAGVRSGDEEFLRRVTLDLTGAIPTPASVNAFASDPSSDKRARKIDELLASEAFNDRWTLWFGDLAQNVQVATNSREYYLGRNAYYVWIRDSIRTGKPYDAMVRELLAGEGDNFQTGVANYIVRQIQRNGPPQDTFDNLAAHSAEKFLGIPLLCISCHSGPAHLELVNTYLRNKTRNDFWKMAAFFSRTTARGSRYIDPQNPNANIIRFDVGLNPNGAYRLNTTDGNKTPRAPSDTVANPVMPAFILTGETPRAGEPYRVAYGRMLTADRQFARATVNHLWKEMFGRAIVEPVNAFDLARLEFQATHPALLEALADELIANGFSLRGTLRTIALSNTYQLSSRYAGLRPDSSYFACREPRRLSAEVLTDAINDATGTPVQFNVQGIGRVERAVRLPDPLDGRRTVAGQFMTHFGRGNRDDVLRSNDGAISQSLALMNDANVVARVRSSGSRTVQNALGSSSDPGAVTDALYLAALSRKPTAEERTAAIDYLRGGALNERTEDLLWVLINSLEFLFN